MDIEIRDKYYVMVFLLEECNFDCPHCVREDEPMEPGYKLSFEQHRRFLADCRGLESVRWVEHSGGETTLWTDGDLNLTDILIAEAGAGLEPGFTSNGSLFVDSAMCHDFFQKYFASASMPLRVYLSIDIFHKNYDAQKGRCLSLDNVLSYRENMPAQKRGLLNIIPLTCVTREPSSVLPEKMRRHYQERGAPFRVLPLRPVGKARSFAHLCPDLSSDSPEKLGAYYPFRPDRPRKTRSEASNLVLIGNNYFLSEPEWHVIGQLGDLPQAVIDAYSGSGTSFTYSERPTFTIEFPEGATRIPFNAPNQVFAAGTAEGLVFQAAVADVYPEWTLDRAAELYVKSAEDGGIGSGFKISSNVEIRLEDGTRAYRSEIRWFYIPMRVRLRTQLVSASKDGKIVSVTVHLLEDAESIPPIAESLRFDEE